MISRDLKLLSAGLGLIAIGLAIGNVTVTRLPSPNLDDRPTRPWTPAGLETTGSVELDHRGANLDQALRRPIFRQSRQPFDPAAAAAAIQAAQTIETPVIVTDAPQIDLGQYILKGVLISDTNQQALIATPDAPDGIWLQNGAELSKWRIAAVKRDGVVLANGSRSVELKLYVDNPSSN